MGKWNLILVNNKSTLISFFQKSSLEDVLIDFRERERKGEREGETSIGCLSYMPRPELPHMHVGWAPPDRGLHLGMCSDQESNSPPFSLRDDTPAK